MTDHHPQSSPLLIVGIGNRFRGDDAVGCLLADRLKQKLPHIDIIEHTGEPATLMDTWKNYESVILIDAVFSGSRAGTLHYIDLKTETLPASFAKPSTHAIGVAEAVEFSRVLGKLPQRIVFYGIEGQNYDSGETLSSMVSLAADMLFDQLTNQQKEVSHA